MSAAINLKFSQVAETIENLQDVEPIRLSQMSYRNKKIHLQYVNKTFDAIMEKVVGSEKLEQEEFLVFQLKRLFRQTKWVSLLSRNLESFKNYGDMTKAQRKSSGRTVYPIFDTLSKKICGIDNMEVQRIFLDARFHSLHAEKPGFTPLTPKASWTNVKGIVTKIGEISEDFAYKELSERQTRRRKNR